MGVDGVGNTEKVAFNPEVKVSQQPGEKKIGNTKLPPAQADQTSKPMKASAGERFVSFFKGVGHAVLSVVALAQCVPLLWPWTATVGMCKHAKSYERLEEVKNLKISPIGPMKEFEARVTQAGKDKLTQQVEKEVKDAKEWLIPGGLTKKCLGNAYDNFKTAFTGKK